MESPNLETIIFTFHVEFPGVADLQIHFLNYIVLLVDSWPAEYLLKPDLGGTFTRLDSR